MFTTLISFMALFAADVPSPDELRPPEDGCRFESARVPTLGDVRRDLYRCEKEFLRADTNNDGRISNAEFDMYLAMRRRGEVRRADMPSPRVRRGDLNRNGVYDTCELYGEASCQGRDDDDTYYGDGPYDDRRSNVRTYGDDRRATRCRDDGYYNTDSRTGRPICPGE